MVFARAVGSAISAQPKGVPDQLSEVATSGVNRR